MKKLFTCFMTTLLVLETLIAFSVPKLNSHPTAVATIFIDFDGHQVQATVWNGGNPFYAAPSGLTEPQIIEAFNRAAEDFRPFNVNLTTDSTVFLAAPLNRRIRIIVTATSNWATPGVGGISYVGSFNWGDDTPAFVFSDRHGYNTKRVAETISHESGHTVGLSHQSRYGADCYTPTETYNSGTGTGETAWSPIMGNSLNRNFSNWNNGPTPYGCVELQDNLAIISTQNGFGYRTDDYPETMNSGTYALNGSNVNVSGIIATNTDKDAFKITLNANSNFNIQVNPYSVGSGAAGANLDVVVELYNASATLIRSYNPLLNLHVTIDTILNAGTYYMMIKGGGNNNIGSYGSLGSYTITGTFSPLPIRDVRLFGTVDKSKHQLNWRIVSDEPIKTIEVQSSTDGTNFGALTNLGATATTFGYEAYKTNTVFYRLKVTSVIDQTVFSNTIALRANGQAEKLFTVSTLVQDNILVNAAENYQYVLNDMNGKAITRGTGLKGINHIYVAGQSKGMYYIQLYSNDKRQTERIIKQ